MDTFIQLGPTQLVPDHPFADAGLNDSDLVAMRRIIYGLCALLDLPMEEPRPGHPFIVRHRDPEGRAVRLVLCDRARVLAAQSMFVVGFFGDRRPDRDAVILNAVDEDLIHEFPQHPGVLSYCSVQMADGNFVNVVLMSGPEDRDHWRTSAKHAYAVRDLAHDFYTSIRLQNAQLAGGLPDGELTIIRTKYFDYGNGAPWFAVREAEAPSPSQPGLGPGDRPGAST